MERSGLAARSAVISRGGEHSIAVVEHEQNLFGSEDPGEGFEKRMASGPAHAERGCNRGDDQVWIRQGGEINEHHPVRSIGHHPFGSRDRQPRLPRPPRSR